ncbi:MAG: serine/threonine protein kinase [Gemmataceae bacterium]|nr:serine/threonine protein kinase [Gemmataceae bacterium]
MTAEQFRDLWQRSRLHPAPEAAALWARWQAVALRPESAADLAAWLVARGALTRYQADILSEGKADHFRFDLYTLEERIGKGAAAKVFRASHPRHGKAALKVLPPSRSRDAEQLARFQREGRLLIRLQHPGIVRGYELGQCRGLHYLAMEYVDGVTLDNVLAERGALPAREAARLGVLALLALSYLHGQGLVHRDIKPGNLILSPAPGPHENTMLSTAKVLDIGLGREMFDRDSPDPLFELTADGSLLGTPDYLSPEQARDPRRADERSDLYSLGCVLYHCLTGKPPFPEDSVVRAILRHASQPPVPVLEVAPSTPADLAGVVHALLAKNPERRYQSADEAAAALQRCLKGR